MFWLIFDWCLLDCGGFCLNLAWVICWWRGLNSLLCCLRLLFNCFCWICCWFSARVSLYTCVSNALIRLFWLWFYWLMILFGCLWVVGMPVDGVIRRFVLVLVVWFLFCMVVWVVWWFSLAVTVWCWLWYWQLLWVDVLFVYDCY